jgi:hypothetical protein
MFVGPVGIEPTTHGLKVSEIAFAEPLGTKDIPQAHYL